jgi:response regulator RpfG family c-di-GMP phosphodiesterase
MRAHPTFARDMLAPTQALHPALEIPYTHHEKWDGSGYPRGLRGEAIPLAARLFAVVDVWVAMHTKRPYRPAYSTDQVRLYLQEQSGKHFDPHLVQVFLEMDEI